MGIELDYRQEPGLLLVEMRGEWTGSAIHEAILAVRAEADTRKLECLLVDVTEVSHPHMELDRFFAGVRWADQFPSRFRAAFVVTDVLYNGFAELVARNRGANVSAHFDEASARSWLDER